MNFPANINLVLSVLVFIVASIFGLFLFYRAGKHELIDEDVVFDSSILACFGALIAGRIADFFIRYNFYNFSFKKLFFFNVWGGFDWYGAAIGATVAVYFLLRKSKSKLLTILDLASAPLVFAAFIVFLGDYILTNRISTAIYFAGLFIIFWILKRFEKLKRNPGFFFSTALIFVSILNLVLYFLKQTESKQVFTIDYNFVMPFATLAIGTFTYSIYTKRNLKEDFKRLEAFLLLTLLKLKRILTSVNEASIISRAIILLPIALSKLAVNFVKLISREVQLSIVELAQVFGFKK